MQYRLFLLFMIAAPPPNKLKANLVADITRNMTQMCAESDLELPSFGPAFLVPEVVMQDAKRRRD